jgi:benzil reductase ((S)-benzoin forming)
MADLITINLTAPMILTNSFLSHYQSSINSKMIINISSGASRKEYDGWAGYSTSKAGLERFSLIVQKEQALQNQNVKVYAVSPSVIDTKMQTEIRHANIQNFSQLEKFINLKNQNELEKPEDIAKKIIYLMENPHRFQEVVQDVRNFEINEN